MAPLQGCSEDKHFILEKHILASLECSIQVHMSIQVVVILTNTWGSVQGNTVWGMGQMIPQGFRFPIREFQEPVKSVLYELCNLVLEMVKKTAHTFTQH